MDDDDLLRRTAEARYRAHNAPKSDTGSPHDAWARHSNDWMKLVEECDRRGLPHPEPRKPDDWS